MQNWKIEFYSVYNNNNNNIEKKREIPASKERKYTFKIFSKKQDIWKKSK